MLADWLLLAVVVALIVVVVVVVVAAGDTEDIILAGRKCHNNNTASSGQVLPQPTNKDEDLAKLPTTTNPLATVYDRVLSSETAEWVHGLCVAWNEESKKHKAQIAAAHNSNEGATAAAATTTDVAVDPADLIFEFPLEHPERHRPLQRFLNDLVWQMLLLEGRNDEQGAFDTTTVPRYYVEYWTRQQWQHILAHQDMDEGWERRLQKERHECQERRRAAANKSGGTPSDENEENCDTMSSDRGFRHPVTGQVLFLKIGPEVQGPTVVFDVLKGSDLVAPNRASKTNGDNTTAATATTKTTKTITMASVPTLEGRLLRFRGDRLHAVPRPYDVYWTFDQSRNHIHTPQTQRSVLLFNLWKQHDDNDSLSMPLGKVLDCGDGSFPRDRTTCFEKWNIESGSENVPSSDVSHHPMCRRKKDWERVSFVEMPSTRDPDPQEASSWRELLWEWLAGGTQQQEFFQVPLLGDAHKRGMAEFVARMQSLRWYDSSGAWIHPTRDGLGEAIQPTLFEIEADERFR